MASVFERQLKRLGLYGLSRLATPPRTGPSESDLAKVRRILVVRPDERIGNAILIIPLLNALKKRFPNSHLSLIMSRRYWDLREFIPSVDEFIAFDKKHYARNPLAFIGLVRRLRRGDFDLVFDASGDHSVSFTHLSITGFSGGRFRIGHNRGETAHCYDVAVPVSEAPRHETERHLDLLRAITTIDADPRPLLGDVPDTGFASRLWNEHNWSGGIPTVIVHPGARGRKRWPALHFAEVARQLVTSGHQVGVVWGPADSEAAREMLSACPQDVKAIGVLAFRDFVSLIRHSDVFFSGDCGPMHLAAAAPPRVGVVTVFVIDGISRYGPLGPRDVAIVDEPGSPRIEAIVSRIAALAGRSQEAVHARSITA